MKKLILFFSTCFLSILVFSQTITSVISIIPEPVTVVRQTGVFTLPGQVAIEAPAAAEIIPVTEFLQRRFTASAGSTVVISADNPTAAVRLQLNKTADAVIGREGYHLLVTPNTITITANEPAGLFYGAQSLIQLFPPEIESNEVLKNVAWQVPCVEVTDYPRFGWRGLMFDVARHFFTKDEVKKFIDDMVRYKFNLLHLHLTDDEGWRIQIKSLPKLTAVGAWNVKKTGYFGTFSPPGPDELRDAGGFYTQEDIKELVQYAKARFVNILPEIDVPGHSLAAVASYPELSCTPGANKYQVGSGEPFMDWSSGTNRALKDNTLCPANEKVYALLDKVITEVAQLFPFEYIHMGGDECAKNYWEKNPAIRELMKKENLKSMHEVQSYFEKRCQKIVLSKGKKFLGWDEILEGGLAPGAVVMSWRGIRGGIEAAKLGHEVVMSPSTFAYLDFMQSDVITEPRVYSTLRLNKAYEFEPVPDGVDPKFIKGGQANIWTEQITNYRHLQYMVWPRALATAESVWSPKEKKNWKSFFSRVEDHFKRFDVMETKYSPAVYDPSFQPTLTADKRLKIVLTKEADTLDLYYSFDNSFPDRFYPKYSGPLEAPKDAVMLRVIAYEGKKQVGRMVSMPLEELRKRAGKKG